MSGTTEGPSRGPDARVRLFVALELPEPVRAALSARAGQWLAGAEAMRLVAPASLHVTLCFLGMRRAGELPMIADACREAAGMPARSLALGEGIWLPSSRRPRVAAVAIEDRDRELAALQAHVSRALAAAGVFRAEQRGFLAHVTVARVRGRGGGPVPLAEPPPSRASLPFAGEAVTLMRSHLGSGPARYEAIARISLVGAG